ncbi:DNA polymerase III, subunits gamma and tau-like protein [Lysobacter enzymogenes]|uniref:DNA polymerase III, subunits gamma and tau-like protein n=1 Tax=Lysobacter enzymogenes TaxID=69 RepID=A0A0S2DC99_LYSEN|nr:DNA polymerase III, subunits gamma and tau-like protein [Lysobacter enzymogenes]
MCGQAPPRVEPGRRRARSGRKNPRLFQRFAPPLARARGLIYTEPTHAGRPGCLSAFAQPVPLPAEPPRRSPAH